MIAPSATDAGSLHGIVSWRDVGSILAAQLAAFGGLLLAASALHKGRHRRETRRVMREFAAMPARAAPAAAAGVVIVEGAAAILMFAPFTRGLGALLAATIWTMYLALILRSLLAGRRDVDCGCGFGGKRHALGAFEVTRNVLLAGMASCVALASLRGGPPLAASQLLGAAALLALYFALEQLRGLRPIRAGVAP